MDTLDNDLSDSGVSQAAKAAAMSASGWMKFIAIFGFVICGLGVIGGFAMLIASPIIGLIYLAIYGAAIYMCIVLIQGAGKLASVGTMGNMSQLNDFLELNKRYWMIAGIFLIVTIALMIIALIVGASFGAGLLNSF